MLRAAVNRAGYLGFDPFKQSTAKCFTSILEDVYHSMVLGNIASNLHRHCHQYDHLHAHDLSEYSQFFVNEAHPNEHAQHRTLV
jgi:hypothetical protein